MEEQSSLLPNMKDFPDCEEKRHVINLAQKLELHLEKMTPDKSFDEIRKLHEESNEIWWEMNSTIGALIAKSSRDLKQDKRWLISLVLSIIALLVSLFSFVIK
ncbi:MAG: hypothetical protein LLG04_17645 [Parachlamydia sp.]|nr:hypothetical protein [Parachlamydia sp.]